MNREKILIVEEQRCAWFVTDLLGVLHISIEVFHELQTCCVRKIWW